MLKEQKYESINGIKISFGQSTYQNHSHVNYTNQHLQRLLLLCIQNQRLTKKNALNNSATVIQRISTIQAQLNEQLAEKRSKVQQLYAMIKQLHNNKMQNEEKIVQMVKDYKKLQQLYRKEVSQLKAVQIYQNHYRSLNHHAIEAREAQLTHQNINKDIKIIQLHQKCQKLMRQSEDRIQLIKNSHQVLVNSMSNQKNKIQSTYLNIIEQQKQQLKNEKFINSEFNKKNLHDRQQIQNITQKYNQSLTILTNQLNKQREKLNNISNQLIKKFEEKLQDQKKMAKKQYQLQLNQQLCKIEKQKEIDHQKVIYELKKEFQNQKSIWRDQINCLQNKNASLHIQNLEIGQIKREKQNILKQWNQLIQETQKQREIIKVLEDQLQKERKYNNYQITQEIKQYHRQQSKIDIIEQQNIIHKSIFDNNESYKTYQTLNNKQENRNGYQQYKELINNKVSKNTQIQFYPERNSIEIQIPPQRSSFTSANQSSRSQKYIEPYEFKRSTVKKQLLRPSRCIKNYKSGAFEEKINKIKQINERFQYSNSNVNFYQNDCKDNKNVKRLQKSQQKIGSYYNKYLPFEIPTKIKVSRSQSERLFNNYTSQLHSGHQISTKNEQLVDKIQIQGDKKFLLDKMNQRNTWKQTTFGMRDFSNVYKNIIETREHYQNAKVIEKSRTNLAKQKQNIHHRLMPTFGKGKLPSNENSCYQYYFH